MLRSRFKSVQLHFQQFLLIGPKWAQLPGGFRIGNDAADAVNTFRRRASHQVLPKRVQRILSLAHQIPVVEIEHAQGGLRRGIARPSWLKMKAK